MAHGVCPYWLGYFLINPFRRFPHNPRRILGEHVGSGMIVLEPGPGLGFFTLDIARMVGPSGRVVAVDVQERMLAGLKRRAAKAGVADRIECRLAKPESLGVDDLAGRFDFVLAFAVVHEVPDPGAFLRQLAASLRPGGRLLLAEPKGHVSASDFDRTLQQAEAAGLRREAAPRVARSHAALLVKTSGA